MRPFLRPDLHSGRDVSLVTVDYGRFVGSVVVEWLDDGRLMKLIAPFAYIAPDGLQWDAPAGSIIDGASIPRFAWSIIGGPFEGKYRNASVIHDVACDERLRSWQEVHQTFYTAMLASDVDKITAKIMYAAVYHFGPRWGTVISMYAGLEEERVESIDYIPAFPEDEFKLLADKIRAEDLSLQNIRDFEG